MGGLSTEYNVCFKTPIDNGVFFAVKLKAQRLSSKDQGSKFLLDQNSGCKERRVDGAVKSKAL